MKAFCINDFGNPNPLVHPIFIGSEYNIVGGVPGHSAYCIIAEHPVSKRGYMAAYRKSCFAILPEQSADEMREEKHEALIYQR